jgi:hypothetical protein
MPAGPGLAVNAASMCLNDLSAEIEADTGSLRVGTRERRNFVFDAEEFFEDPFAELIWDAGT